MNYTMFDAHVHIFTGSINAVNLPLKILGYGKKNAKVK